VRWIFWGSVVFLCYTYFGYLAVLWVRNLVSKRPVHAAPFFPSVSIVMIVRNEADVIERKLRNLETLAYPSSKKEIIVVSDGSTDKTNEILKEFDRTDGPRIIFNSPPRGKAAGLNSAIELTRGEILVFTDARQRIENDAVQILMENFCDPSVGCVSGELMLGDERSNENTTGLSMYWKLEKRIREMESASGSVVGATGAFYAVRRTLVPYVPEEIILDDVYIPMHVVREGSRVVFDNRARAWDKPDLGRQREYARKVRTLSGNYQLLRIAPWLLGNTNPIRFRFFSHKLTRLAAPFALLACFATSCFLPGPIYTAAMSVQLMCYGLGLLGFLSRPHGLLGTLTNAAFSFVMLNVATIAALLNFLVGRKVLWSVAPEATVESPNV